MRTFGPRALGALMVANFGITAALEAALPAPLFEYKFTAGSLDNTGTVPDATLVPDGPTLDATGAGHPGAEEPAATNQSLWAPPSAQLSDATADVLDNRSTLTFSTWINIENYGSTFGLFQNSGESTPTPDSTAPYTGILMISSRFASGSFRMDVFGPDGHSAQNSSPSGVLEVGKWKFVTGVYDGTQADPNDRVRLYAGDPDGNFDELAVSHNAVPNPSSYGDNYRYGQLQIARASNYGAGGNGLMDNVRFFGAALTAEQVEELYLRDLGLFNPTVPGDLDGDGDVDFSDLSTLVNYYGQTNVAGGLSAGDIDGDMNVDFNDLSTLINY